MVILASPNTLGHSANVKLIVINTLMCLYSLDSRWPGPDKTIIDIDATLLTIKLLMSMSGRSMSVASLGQPFG